MKKEDLIRHIEEANAAGTQPPDDDVETERHAPRGRSIGWVDEYGTVWSGAPGAQGSKVIGDLVRTTDDEIHHLYLEI